MKSSPEDLMLEEWEAWKEIVHALKIAKAVTEADCNSRISDRNSPGTKLFALLRKWGDLRSQQGKNT